MKRNREHETVYFCCFFFLFNWCLLYFVISAGTLWWYWSNYNFFIYFAWWRWKIIISLSNRQHKKKGFFRIAFIFVFLMNEFWFIMGKWYGKLSFCWWYGVKLIRIFTSVNYGNLKCKILQMLVLNHQFMCRICWVYFNYIFF